MADIIAKKVERFEEVKEPGNFYWTNDYHMTFLCPCGCGGYRAVEIGPTKWKWDGDRDHPTITPSIRVIGECEWHGFLTAGVFRSC